MGANKGLEVTGIVEMQERIERLMHFDPSFEKRIQKVIDATLVAVRKGVIKDAADVMKSDPRGAARAVRRSVYKRILGGQVNILKKRRAGKMGELPDADSKQHWRRRGYKTGQMSRYLGSDRGFILRFLNKGTVHRGSKTIDNHNFYRKSPDERPAHRRYVNNYMLGYRGRTGDGSRNFFEKSKSRMEAELPTLEKAIEQLIIEEFNR